MEVDQATCGRFLSLPSKGVRLSNQYRVSRDAAWPRGEHVARGKSPTLSVSPIETTTENTRRNPLRTARSAATGGWVESLRVIIPRAGPDPNSEPERKATESCPTGQGPGSVIWIRFDSFPRLPVGLRTAVMWPGANLVVRRSKNLIQRTIPASRDSV